MEVNWKK